MLIRIKSFIAGVILQVFLLSVTFITGQTLFYSILDLLNKTNPLLTFTIIFVFVVLSYFLVKFFIQQFYLEDLTKSQKVIYFGVNIFIFSVICSLILCNYYDFYFIHSIKYISITPVLSSITLALIPYLIGNIANSYGFFFTFEKINYYQLRHKISYIKSIINNLKLRDAVTSAELKEYCDILNEELKLVIEIATGLRSEEKIKTEQVKLSNIINKSISLRSCMIEIYKYDRKVDFLNIFKSNPIAMSTNDCCSSIAYFRKLKIFQ